MRAATRRDRRLTAPGGNAFQVSRCTGRTPTRQRNARCANPRRNGWMTPVRDRVPSGKTSTLCPSRR